MALAPSLALLHPYSHAQLFSVAHRVSILFIHPMRLLHLMRPIHPIQPLQLPSHVPPTIAGSPQYKWAVLELAGVDRVQTPWLVVQVNEGQI